MEIKYGQITSRWRTSLKLGWQREQPGFGAVVVDRDVDVSKVVVVGEGVGVGLSEEKIVVVSVNMCIKLELKSE